MNLSENQQNRLEAQKWYHGLSTRDICSQFLKEKGDFLVRASQKGTLVGITLNVKTESEKKTVDNFVITTVGNENRYALRAVMKENNFPSFDCVPNLVKYYKINDLPNGIRLRRAISRPRWLISNEAIVYENNCQLGSGNFGAVYKGMLHGCTPCAIKVVQIKYPNGCENDVEQENEARIGMIREADLMASYHHDNIVQFLGFACFHPPLMLVLELCNGGSLDKHLRKNGYECSDYEKMVYVLEAARGMNYLHKKKCIHRDLAARNCLIDKKGTIKISDFGLSVILKEGTAAVTDQMNVIPLRWMAPECLRAKMQFSSKSDVWAFGVLIYEIFSNGSKPFMDLVGEDADRKITKSIKNCQMPRAPDGSHSRVQELFDELWQKDPQKRPSFDTIVKKIISILKDTDCVELKDFVLNNIPGIQRELEPNLDFYEKDKRPNSLIVNGKKKSASRRRKLDNFSYRLASIAVSGCSTMNERSRNSFRTRERQRKQLSTDKQTTEDDEENDKRTSIPPFQFKSNNDLEKGKISSITRDICITPPTSSS